MLLQEMPVWTIVILVLVFIAMIFCCFTYHAIVKLLRLKNSQQKTLLDLKDQQIKNYEDLVALNKKASEHTNRIIEIYQTRDKANEIIAIILKDIQEQNFSNIDKYVAELESLPLINKEKLAEVKAMLESLEK
jgi:hypothetical protein